MIAGTLEIQLAANMARLADDMAKSKGLVGDAMKGIEGAVASAKSALGALGIGLSVGYFVSLIRGSIDAMDHLNDLSKTTTLAVETLAGLKIAAKQSGSDLESTANSINKLSVEVGKAPEKFKALGISATDPLEQFKQLADITNKLSDVNQRNAVLAAALGKSWQGAVPLLAEGSTKIGEMVTKGTELSRVTAESARKSDELNDKWIELVGTGGLLNSLVGKMLDPLLRLTNQMIAARDASDGFLGTMARFFMIGGNQAADPVAAIEKIDEKLVILRQTAKEFAEMGWFKRMFSADDIAIVNRQIAFLETQRDMLERLKKLSAPEAPPPKLGDDPAGAAEAAARAARFLGKEDAAKDAERRAQQIRDIMHAVQEANDKRELDQIGLTNEQKAEAARLFVIQMLELEEQLQDAKDTIQRESALGRQAREKQEHADQIAGALSFTADLASLMNSQSRKAFELGKVASIANALIKGYEAAVSSYAFGAKIGGPYLGAAFAAASILATANLINNIRSQHFGGGGGGGGALGGAPVSTGQGASNFNTQQQQQIPTPASLVLNVTVNGHVLDTQEFTDTILVPALKDAINNRDVKIIGANSRQAADLVAG